LRIRSRAWSCGALALILLITGFALTPASSASRAEEKPLSTTWLEPFKLPPFLEALLLRGGVLATFDVHGESFRVWVTNSQAVEQLFALEEGRSTATIPVGRIHLGPGRAAHNWPWFWHLDPEHFGLAEFTIEVCDARPSYVQQNLTYFIYTVGTYCPWAAVLVELEDFR
jgi:hypothetical protein